MDGSTVYSAAPEASRKKAMDLSFVGWNVIRMFLIDIHNEIYLKQLIKTASNNMVAVSTLDKRLQFFIIKGGAEGFLAKSYDGIDASRVVKGGGVTTSGQPKTTMIWEDNDLLAVFDQRGNLINAALLRRPLSITGPNLPPDFWTEPTANAVFDGWDKQYVSLYHNANYDIKYYGLQINDSGHWYSSGKARIDIHKQEATNGCIFIVDGDTPPYPSADDDKDTAAAKRAKLDSFEPKLIQDIQKAIGAKAKSDFGIMRVIKIK